MKKFIAIDFETASEQKTTPVSVGFVQMIDNIIVEGSSFFSLINPKTTLFNSISIAKHGIKPSMVSDAPDFSEIWNTKLKDFLKDHIVIVHQTASDISIIKQCVELFNLEKIEFEFVSTLAIAQKLNIETETKGMKDLCKYFNIPFADNHKSDEDAIAVARLFIELSKNKSFKLEKFLKWEFKPRPVNTDYYTDSIQMILEKYQLSYSELKEIDFNGKSFCFSGSSIKEHPEDEIKQKIIEKGGIEKTSISTNLDFFIAGISPGPAKVTQIDVLNTSKEKQIKVINLSHIIEFLYH